MTFRQLEYLCALVQEGSVSKASNRLVISQPALSQQIIALEKEYDIKILDRSAGAVKVTAEGMMFYDSALAILTLKEELEGRLRKSQKAKLYIKTINFYAQTFVPYLLAVIRREYGNADLKIIESTTAQLFTGQHYENIDLYIHAFDMNTDEELMELDDEHYIHEKLLEEEIVIAMNGDNPALKRLTFHEGKSDLDYVDLSELKRELFVTTTTSEYLKKVGETLCRELGGFEPTFINGEPTFVKLLGLIQFNDCIAIMPSTVRQYAPMYADIRFFGIKGSNVKRQVVVSRLKSKKLSSVAKTFIERAKEMKIAAG